MGIIFNQVTLNSIFFNGTEIYDVIYNGINVYHKPKTTVLYNGYIGSANAWQYTNSSNKAITLSYKAQAYGKTEIYKNGWSGTRYHVLENGQSAQGSMVLQPGEYFYAYCYKNNNCYLTVTTEI